MQAKSPIHIFIVTLECPLSNEDNIPVNKATLYNLKKCVCKIVQYVIQPMDWLLLFDGGNYSKNDKHILFV